MVHREFRSVARAAGQYFSGLVERFLPNSNCVVALCGTRRFIRAAGAWNPSSISLDHLRADLITAAERCLDFAHESVQEHEDEGSNIRRGGRTKHLPRRRRCGVSLEVLCERCAVHGRTLRFQRRPRPARQSPCEATEGGGGRRDRRARAF